MGVYVFRLSSVKIKLSGESLQFRGLIAPAVLLTLNGLNSNNVPDPFSGTKFCDVAAKRRVLVVPGPVLRMEAERFQSGSLVSPALCTIGDCGPLVAKPITDESKVKSPWKLM